MNKLLNYYQKKLGNIPSFFEKYLTVPCLVRLKKIGYFFTIQFNNKIEKLFRISGKR